jgi:hypothetical protein
MLFLVQLEENARIALWKRKAKEADIKAKEADIKAKEADIKAKEADEIFKKV